MFLLNQMETNRRLDQLAYEVHHQDGHRSAGDTGEGAWYGGPDDMGEGGGSWGDGGSGGADGGGGWGDAGGDFGGGDGGGGW
jgi:hypothetical protein